MRRATAAIAAALLAAAAGMGLAAVNAQQLFGFNDPTQPQLGGTLPQAMQTIPSPPGISSTSGSNVLTATGTPQALSAASGYGTSPPGTSPQALLSAMQQQMAAAGGAGGTGGPCPVLTFSQSVNRDSLGGAGHTIAWTAQNPVASSSAVIGTGGGSAAAASWTVMFVDVHFKINSGPEVNIRMNPNSADSKSWILPGLNLMDGDTVSYYFTICTVINGVRTDCDSPRFTFTKAAGSTGGTGTAPTAPSSIVPLGNPQALLGGQQPQLPQQFQQLLTQQQQLQPQMPPTQSIVMPLSGGSSSGSAVCPAVNWQWQLLPAPNAPNTYAMQFIAQSANNPQQQLLGVSSVDIHYVLGATPQNVRMVQLSPNSWSANIALTADQAKQGANTPLTMYFTYTAVLAGSQATANGATTNSITCDTAQTALTAASGVFSTTTSGSGSGTVTPSGTSGTGGTGNQPLMSGPPQPIAVFNPFAPAPSSGGTGTGTGSGTTNPPSLVPPGTPDFARGQTITTPEAVAQFLREQQQNNNPFSGSTPNIQPLANPPQLPGGTGATTPGGCPAIDINQQVTPSPDGTGAWTVTFFAIQPRAPGAVLQSIERVGITASTTTAPTLAVNSPMDRINGLVWDWDVPASMPAAASGGAAQPTLKAGDTLRYTFNYTALINGARVSCNTSQFAFSVAPMGGPVAPAGQPSGATTPLQLAQLQQQMISTGFNPMRAPTPPQMQQPPSAGVQPLSANPQQQQFPMDAFAQGQFLPPNTRSQADLVRGTVSDVCPSMQFTQRLEPNAPVAASGSNPAAPSTGGVRAVFMAGAATKGALEKVNFVDFHLLMPASNPGPEINQRMLQANSGDDKSWTLTMPLAQVPAGATYYFTHSSTISGQRVDCDTPLITVSTAVTGANGAGGSAPLFQQPPTQFNPNANPMFPQGMQQPLFPTQPLQGANTPTGPGGLMPSGPLGQPAAGGSGGTGSTPTSPGTALPCPALQWSYSMVPSNTAGVYKLQFTGGRPLRPDATVAKINYVDLHYTINGAAPQNVNMQLKPPTAGATTTGGADASTTAPWEFDPLALKSGDTMHWYHTYSATFGGATTPIQCDTGIQMFVAPPTSGILPSATGTPTTGGSGTNPTAPLLGGTGLPALGSSGGTPQAPGGTGALPALPNGGGAPAAPVMCPAITFDRQILPLGNGQYELRFVGNSGVNPSANLQSINFVDAHYVINAASQVNTKMLRKEGSGTATANGLTFTLPLSLPAGSQFAVYFTYSALLSSSSTPVQCDSAVFSFAN